MAVNPWVGYEASAYVVGARRRERARLHRQLQGAEGGRLLAGLRHRRGRRRDRGLGPPRPGEEVLRREGRRHRDGLRPDRATSASSAGSSRRGSPRSTPTSSTGTTSTSSPSEFATSESGGKGQFLGADPSYVQFDEAIVEQPRPRLQGRLLRLEAASIEAFQQGRGEQGVDDRLLLRAAVVLRGGADGRRSRCRRTRRAARTTRPRSPATTRRPCSRRSSPPTWVEEGGPRRRSGPELHLDERGPEPGRRRTSPRTACPEDAAAKWVEENPDKVDAWLG